MNEQELKSMLLPATAEVHKSLAAMASLKAHVAEELGGLHSVMTRDLESLERRIRLAADALRHPAEVPEVPEVPEAWKPYIWSVDEPPALPRETPIEQHQLYAALWENRDAVFCAAPEGDARSGPLFGASRGYVPRAMYELVMNELVQEGGGGKGLLPCLLDAAFGRVWLEKVYTPFAAGKVTLEDPRGWASSDPFMRQALGVARTAIVMARWES